MKVAELLPQCPVFAERQQSGRGLPQVYDVAGIRKLGDDGALCVQRQVVEREAAAGVLARQWQG